MTEPTFGCGTYLPGFGPRNLDDYDDDGGDSWGGGGDPDPPGIIDGDKIPDRPGDGDPPGSGGPGDIVCRCYIQGGPTNVGPGGGPPGATHGWRWSQKCFRNPIGIVNDPSFANKKAQIAGNPNVWDWFVVVGTPNQPCFGAVPTECACNDTTCCPPIFIYAKKKAKKGGEQGPVGPVGKDCTCVIQGPPQPQTPGAGGFPNDADICVKFNQKCIEHFGPAPPHDPSYQARIVQLASNPNILWVYVSNPGDVGKTCKDASTGECACEDTTCCPPIFIYAKFRARKAGENDDGEPGQQGGGGGGGGGPAGPAGPAGPPIPPGGPPFPPAPPKPAPGGGGGGGGGPVTPGPPAPPKPAPGGGGGSGPGLGGGLGPGAPGGGGGGGSGPGIPPGTLGPGSPTVPGGGGSGPGIPPGTLGPGSPTVPGGGGSGPGIPPGTLGPGSPTVPGGGGGSGPGIPPGTLGPGSPTVPGGGGSGPGIPPGTLGPGSPTVPGGGGGSGPGIPPGTLGPGSPTVPGGGGSGGGITGVDGGSPITPGEVESGGGGIGGTGIVDGGEPIGGVDLGENLSTGVGGGLSIDSEPDFKYGGLLPQQGHQINLNDPTILRAFSRTDSAGLMDEEIAILGRSTPSRPNDLVSHNFGMKTILGNKIHKSIAYVLKNNHKRKDWDSVPVYDITTASIIASINPTFLAQLRAIRHLDGSRLSDTEIATMFRTRIIDGSLSQLPVMYLRSLSEFSEKRKSLEIIKSSNQAVNELAAIQLIEQNLIPLAPSSFSGRGGPIMDNWKTLATDIAKYIPVFVSGTERRYYVNDDDRFIDRGTLQLSDGDYFLANTANGQYRIYCGSEKSHAYIINQVTRQRALKLLGSDGSITLRGETPAANNLEFEYSLSAPRQNFYILSCNLSAVSTSPAAGSHVSNLVKTTTAKYELMDTSSLAGLRDADEFIKYKSNYRTFILDDDDRLLDYIEAEGYLKTVQDDILFDTSKGNRRQPLLTRQLPWYIVVYPTNRHENLLFNTKSHVSRYDATGTVTRELKMKPTLDAVLTHRQGNKFIKSKYAYPDNTDIYGEYNTNARINTISVSSGMYRDAYISNKGVVGSAEDIKPVRRKTAFRIVRSIIKELNDNYLLDDGGLGVGVNTFDVFSRMSMMEFNQFVALENPDEVFTRIKAGDIEGVRVYNPVRNAGMNAIKKTRLVQRKADAPADQYTSIKTTKSGLIIKPPTTIFQSSTLVASDAKPSPAPA